MASSIRNGWRKPLGNINELVGRSDRRKKKGKQDMTKRTEKCKGLCLLAAAMGLCLALLGVATPALAENAVTAEVPFSYAVKGELAPKDAEATFKIAATDEGETLLPVSETVTSKPGIFKFVLKGEVTQPGEHHYHVTQIAGSDKDWNYDAAEFDVTVFVGWENGVAGSTLNQIQVSFFDKDGSLDKDPGFANTCNKKPFSGNANTPAKTTKGGKSVVKTGDTTQPLWIGIGMAGAVAVAFGIWERGRKDNGREF